MKENLASDLEIRLKKIDSSIDRVSATVDIIGTSKLMHGAGKRLNLELISGQDYLVAAIEVGKIRAKIKEDTLPFLQSKKAELELEVKTRQQEKLKHQLQELYERGHITQEEFEKAFKLSAEVVETQPFKQEDVITSESRDVKAVERRESTIYVPSVFTDRIRLLHFIVDFPNSSAEKILSMTKIPTFFESKNPSNVYAARAIRKSLDILYIRDQRGILTRPEAALSKRLVQFMSEMGFEKLSELKEWVISKFELSLQEKLDLGLIDRETVVEAINTDEACSVVSKFHQNQAQMNEYGLRPIPVEMIDAFRKDAASNGYDLLPDWEINRLYEQGIKKILNILKSGNLEEVYENEPGIVQDLLVYFCIIDAAQMYSFIDEISAKYIPPIKLKDEQEVKPETSQFPVRKEVSAPIEITVQKPEKKSAQERMREELKETVNMLVDEVFGKVESNEIQVDVLHSGNQVNRSFQRLKKSEVERIVSSGRVRPSGTKDGHAVFNILDIVMLLFYRDRNAGLPKKYQKELEKIVQDEVELRLEKK